MITLHNLYQPNLAGFINNIWISCQNGVISMRGWGYVGVNFKKPLDI